jgi:glycosyltransferase involved in cell wall biosynthesis
MRILTLSSPGGGHCGIGDYNANLSAALRMEGHQIDLIPLPRTGDRTPIIREFQRRIESCDAAILQSDGWLYGDTPAERFRNFATAARSLGKRPAIAILHEAPPPPLARWPLLKPWSRSYLPAWKDYIARRAMIDAMNSNLTMLVHGEYMRSEWINIGVSPQRINAIVFPMQPSASLIEPRPLAETATVELTMFGFVKEYKGYEVALNAMRVLPENYVLTIAGGSYLHEPNDRTMDAIHGFIQTGAWPYRMWFGSIASVPRRYSGAERRSMEARIKFTGHLHCEQVADVMGRTDIALAPYRRSCGSAALADYVEYCRPTIASALPTFCDFAAHAKCIRLVGADAPFELAYAIRQLAMDLDERRRMFEAARAFAETYSFAALARHCISIFGTSQPNKASAGSVSTHGNAVGTRVGQTRVAKPAP